MASRSSSHTQQTHNDKSSTFLSTGNRKNESKQIPATVSPEKQANNIRQSPAFHTAIVKHGELLKETYKKHPLFYKIIFRNSRFIICSTILSIYYHQPTAGLKDIKAFLKERT